MTLYVRCGTFRFDLKQRKRSSIIDVYEGTVTVLSKTEMLKKLAKYTKKRISVNMYDHPYYFFTCLCGNELNVILFYVNGSHF